MCAKDAAVPYAVEAYLRACQRLGANRGHVQSVGLMLDRIKTFQEAQCKVPDTLGDELVHTLGLKVVGDFT